MPIVVLHVNMDWHLAGDRLYIQDVFNGLIKIIILKSEHALHSFMASCNKHWPLNKKQSHSVYDRNLILLFQLGANWRSFCITFGKNTPKQYYCIISKSHVLAPLHLSQRASFRFLPNALKSPIILWHSVPTRAFLTRSDKCEVVNYRWYLENNHILKDWYANINF